MSIAYNGDRIKVAVDVKSREAITDQGRGGNITFYRGTNVRLEVTGFYGDPADDSSDVLNVVNLASLTVEVKDAATRAINILPAKTISAASINSALTKAAFVTGGETDCHAVVEYLASETAPDLSGALSADYHLVISAITSDAAPKSITWGIGTLTIIEDGHGTGTTPAPVGEVALTLAMAAGLFMRKRTAAGEVWQLMHSDGLGGVQLKAKKNTAGVYTLEVTEIRNP